MHLPIAAEFLLLAALWGSSFLFMMLGAAEFGPWAAATLTRKPAVAQGPNSAAPNIMNKNEEPQRAAKSRNSAAMGRCIGEIVAQRACAGGPSCNTGDAPASRLTCPKNL